MSSLPPDSSTPPLLRALDDARRRHGEAQARWEQYNGNNPNKFSGALGDLAAEVHKLEVACKDAGLVPKTPRDQLHDRLDARYPNAGSRFVGELDGVIYKRMFTPVSTSRSGKTVKGWEKSWEALSADSKEARDFADQPREPDACQRVEDLRLIWSFARPTGGVLFREAIGELNLEASTSRVTWGWRKRGTQLRLKLTAPKDLWDQIAASARAIAQSPEPHPLKGLAVPIPNASPELATALTEPDLVYRGTGLELKLGRIGGQDVFVIKKGAGFKGLALKLQPSPR